MKTNVIYLNFLNLCALKMMKIREQNETFNDSKANFSKTLPKFNKIQISSNVL